jgi:hypothetical protein
MLSKILPVVQLIAALLTIAVLLYQLKEFVDRKMKAS